MTKLTVGKIVFGQERKLPDELTLNNITFKTSKPAPVEIIPGWMIVSAIRYALGRKTSIVSTTCKWVVKNWRFINAATREQIKHDINDAFSDYSRCKHLPNLKYRSPLGMKCDIKEWKKVRNLWRK